MITITASRKLLCGALAAAALATTVLPSAAEAGWRGRRNVAIGAGIIGGIAAGALIAGAAHAYARPHAYYAPVYAEPDCYWVRERRVNRWGEVFIRRVRVCE